LLMLDIDHFKFINDNYGHAAGDEVLRQFADILKAELRTIDTPGRLGGEEFAILLPGITTANAMTTAERLRKRIEATRVNSINGPIHFTVSIGGTLISPQDKAYEAALHRADNAMYKAKDAGRNQTKWQDLL
ncbi:MAG: GGDEF domain-containing protein, partial [Methylococcaceae bacterium]|nr:GGDEF domain-containing protein [Methylococcaceae bacterium]